MYFARFFIVLPSRTANDPGDYKNYFSLRLLRHVITECFSVLTKILNK